MATKRREAVKRLAELLEIEIEPGEATSELMERCIAEVEGQRAEAFEREMSEGELSDAAELVRQQGESRAVRMLVVAPAPAPAPEQPRGFVLEAPKPKRSRRRRAAA